MAYTPRLDSNGMANNFHWYSNDNPYEATGYGMPNCTAYAWGRFWEIGDPGNTGAHKPDPTELPGYYSGQAWWNRVDTSVYQKGQIPALGAVICFTGGTDGHVAIVEVINSDGSIVTSNSAYGGPYFYTQTLYPNNFYSWTSTGGNLYTCQGFIYNPYGDGPGPGPTPFTPGKSTFPWAIYLHRYRARNTR